ncbi:mitochondrial small ribosomal subunit Rsm22-domain-containing protein [Syncephalis pseudoplumigaleata]|uniref:Mitochondrial small ribosomal subunit Rsm22-domain-containing protein n=1 Tax=Syncephalis pseudoplumigaleata TaxID=1712513 RepID=A0A4P9Z4R2_9FUNG|nr:mitochondrial small ribosomal subunit Rsm22-domain-containing protein [Syncephalis pseudoplumigaleata]|eukprot:RKP27455.1 mitochondrial small ribosomal subunit Rsm22-domain-containing protein [Syncephalis pseudoplumigaleata]
MPTTYGVTYNVLNELARRMPTFSPASVLDFGTGPGTGIWAAASIWNDEEGKRALERCMGVDVSESMLRLAEELLTERPASLANTELVFRRYLSYNVNNPPYDLTVAAFTLGDMSSDAVRQSTLEALWKQTSDVLVLIDRGTPEGFRLISEARSWLLDGSMAAESPCHVVAPRIQRPTFMIRAKQAKNNYEDTKYSYLIVRKGKRPTALVQPSTSTVERGYLQRMTIPKSQGKLPYRDARKSLWGDLFPHPPKKPARTRVASMVEATEAIGDEH